MISVIKCFVLIYVVVYDCHLPVWIGISIGISIGKIFSSVLHIGSIWEQVDILISKNQALQILYLKHIKLHKLPWTETHENLIPTKLNNDTV